MDATLTKPASAFSRWSSASSYDQLSMAIARPPQDIANSKSSTNDASRHDPSPCLRPVAYRNEAYLDGEGNLLTHCCRVATRPPGQPCTLDPKSLRVHETFTVAEPEP
ncbi:hypothetical protein EV122DRAFT_290700 [Schizophyllum commune]